MKLLESEDELSLVKGLLRLLYRNELDKSQYHTIKSLEKKKDENGMPMQEDEEFYSFTGSKILIDQAMNDFTVEDLPCPTVIQQFRAKNGQTFVKFT